MLKHVQISPLRLRSDSLSCRSRASTSSGSTSESGLGSGPESGPVTAGCGPDITDSVGSDAGYEPDRLSVAPSRAWSVSSLADPLPRTTLRIHTACLRQDVAYRTLSVSLDCSSREVVSRLLRRCRMRHRDPRLFYLTMELAARKSGARSVLALDNEARPAALQACHPQGYSRFSLQVRRGGLVRVHDSALSPASRYKSLLLSEQTTADELLALLLNCHDSREPVEQFSLYEVCASQEYQRKLHPDDLPLRAQSLWGPAGRVGCHFLVRRNPDYNPPLMARRKLVALTGEVGPSLGERETQAPSVGGDTNAITTAKTAPNFETNEISRTSFNNNNNLITTVNCKICKDSFRTCEFCQKPETKAILSQNSRSYQPVYRMRTISCGERSLTSSFKNLKLSERPERRILALDSPSGPQSLTTDISSNGERCFYI